MISEMAAVEILGPVEVFHEAVEIIQEAGALHIVETPLAEFGRTGLLEKIHLTENQAEEREACARTAEILDEMVADIPAPYLRAVSGPFSAAVKAYIRLRPLPMEALSARSRTLVARVRSFTRRDRNITSDIDALAAYEAVLAGFAPLVETRELPRDFEMVGVVFERRNKLARDALNREIERITSGTYPIPRAAAGRRTSRRADRVSPSELGAGARLRGECRHRQHGLPLRTSGTSPSRRPMPRCRRKWRGWRVSAGGCEARWRGFSARTRQR